MKRWRRSCGVVAARLERGTGWSSAMTLRRRGVRGLEVGFGIIVIVVVPAMHFTGDLAARLAEPGGGGRP